MFASRSRREHSNRGALEATVVAAAMPMVADQLGGLSYDSWVFSATGG